MLKGTITAVIAAIAFSTGTAIAALPTGAANSAQAYIGDAQRLIATGDLRAAEIQLKNAVQANPDDPNAHILLGGLYLKVGNPSNAEGEIRLARQHGASEASTASLLARALVGQGKIDLLLQQVKPANRPAAEESAVRVALGLGHLALGEFDNAKPLFDQAQQLDPGNLDARLAQARLFITQHDFEHATSDVDFALGKDPKRPDALVLKGQILAAQGDLQGSLDRYGEVLQADANNIAARTARADVFMAQNKIDDAQKDVDAVLSQQPGQLAGNYLRALILSKQGKYSDADEVLQKVSGQFGRFSAGLYLQAAVKYQLAQFAQADDLLTKVIAREPDNANARRLLARVAVAERDNARAIKTLQPLLDANPKDGNALMWIAQAYANQGNRDKALDYYQQAAALRPEDAAMQTKVAVLRMDAGQIDQGLASLEQLTETAQGAKVAGPTLVLSAMRLGKIDEAAKAAEALVNDNPTDSTDLNLLGTVRLVQKRYPEAEKIFTTIIQQDDKFLSAQRNLGLLYLMTGRADDAKQTYQHILNSNPSDVQALASLAAVALQQKQIDEAADFLKRAQNASANDPSPGLDLMRLYTSQKQWPKAITTGQDLLTKFPKSSAVLDGLAKTQLASADIQGGVETLRRLTDIAPKSAAAWEEYALAQAQAKDLPGAHASFLQALTIEPSNDRVRAELVGLDYRTGGIDSALKTAQLFAKDDPVAADVLSATALEQAGRHTDALALLTLAQKTHPDSKILVSIATLERSHGQVQEADSQLKEWLKQHDTDSVARQALAESYLAEKQFGPAQAEFERLNKDQPKNIIALNNLAWLYQEKGDPRARTLAEQAYALAPAAPAVADTLGWIIVSNGDPTSALPYLKKAAAAAADSMDIQYHLAVALQRTGQSEQARAILQRIVASKQAFESKADAEKLLGQLERG